MPPASCGAVERIWNDLAHCFVQQGHTVTILCRTDETQRSEEIVDGIRYVRQLHLRRTRSVYWDLVKDLVYSLKMFTLLPAADVCITNCFWLPVLASRYKRRIGKVVVAVHRYPKGQMGLYGACDRLATVSNAVARAIVSQTPQVQSLVKVFPNPVDTSLFKPPARARSWARPHKLLYTGRIHPEKGIHLLVQAFGLLVKEFPYLRLVIIGPTVRKEGGGGTAYLHRLNELAHNLPVEFLAPVYDKHILVQQLQDAHYYCYPSLAEQGEAFGMAPLEAMATGLVPVVSNLNCFRDFIVENQTGCFFDHRSESPAQSLADVLRRLIIHPERMAQMGSQAVRSTKAFSLDAIAEHYLRDWGGLGKMSNRFLAA